MSDSIDTILNETRVFPPSPEFSKQAVIGDRAHWKEVWEKSQQDPIAFWEKAASLISWFKPWSQTLEWKSPFAKWFVGATTNACYNCVDRHVEEGRGETIALRWEGEDGAEKKITYKQLLTEVSRLAHVLESDLGLKKGDSAAIYMPLIPEAVFAMLACARIGVVHNVIFAGFSAKAIADRVEDAGCKVVLTSDVGYRKGQELELGKSVVDAVGAMDQVTSILTLKRKKGAPLSPKELDWQSLVEKAPAQHQFVELDSEHPLFILYTSGTTGKPKGILHTTGGYLVGTAQTAKWVFDLQPQDIYWCTADIGWITGHSYVVYGLLSQGASILIYEGAPTYPTVSRCWEIVDKHQVSILYTAPTAIRAFMKEGEGPVEKCDLSSLRLLGSVGEPINPQAWMWYFEQIGKSKCPIVDTWWQTETGAIMISPLPGVVPTKPGSASFPFPGIVADVVNEEGQSCKPNEGGYLVIKHPWPSMLRNIHGDSQRYQQQYWSKFEGMYFAGDGAHRDEEGYFWIKGRVDDVLNISGHRLGTMEIESALVSHPVVSEAAVVGKSHPTTGECIVAYVIAQSDASLKDFESLEKDLKAHVVSEIGALARPHRIFFTPTLPKTRSGKIMRRLLKSLAEEGKAVGDTTTLENPDLVQILNP